MKKNKQEQELELQFNIDQIELNERQISKPPIRPLQKKDFGYEVGLEVKVNGEEGKTVHTITIFVKGNEDKVEYGSISVSCTFIIYNFPVIVDIKEDSFVIPEYVIELLNTVTIGTARGIFFSEFRGTFLEKALLPILDVKAFQKQN